MRSERWVALLALGALGAGWRGGAEGVVSGAHPPDALTRDAPVAWLTRLSAWSNASPVLRDGQVCTTLEPVQLTCLDAETGAVLWTTAHDVATALGDELDPAVAAGLTRVEALEERLAGLRRDQSALRRALRADPTAAATVDRLNAATAELGRLTAELDALRPYLTPPNQEMIGWSTPTPVVHEGAVLPLFTQGVVARVEADGRVAWQRWLGERPHAMRGYSVGASASPRLVEGRLIVPHGRLRALDPGTGATLWEGEPYDHYGTPTVARAGGRPWLVLPGGAVVDPRTGTQVADAALPVWFTSPVAAGDHVGFVGAREPDMGPLRVWWMRLIPDGDAVRWETVTEVDLGRRARMYAAPVVHDGVLWAADDEGEVYRVELATGSFTVEPRSLDTPGVYAALTVAGGRLWMGVASGALHSRDLADGTWSEHPVEPFRSVPRFVGDRVYLRTLSGVVAYARGR